MIEISTRNGPTFRASSLDAARSYMRGALQLSPKATAAVTIDGSRRTGTVRELYDWLRERPANRRPASTQSLF